MEDLLRRSLAANDTLIDQNRKLCEVSQKAIDQRDGLRALLAEALDKLDWCAEGFHALEGKNQVRQWIREIKERSKSL